MELWRFEWLSREPVLLTGAKRRFAARAKRRGRNIRREPAVAIPGGLQKGSRNCPLWRHVAPGLSHVALKCDSSYRREAVVFCSVEEGVPELPPRSGGCLYRRKVSFSHHRRLHARGIAYSRESAIANHSSCVKGRCVVVFDFAWTSGVLAVA